MFFFSSSPFLLFFKHLPPSQSRSKFFEYFPVAKSFVSFFGRHLLLGAYNGNNGETRERVIVSVFLIYNRVPRIRMHYSRLHSVTRKAFQPSSIISRVENPFRWKWGGVEGQLITDAYEPNRLIRSHPSRFYSRHRCRWFSISIQCIAYVFNLETCQDRTPPLRINIYIYISQFFFPFLNKILRATKRGGLRANSNWFLILAANFKRYVCR